MPFGSERFSNAAVPLDKESVIFIVSKALGTENGRSRPALQVTARRDNYHPELTEGVVSKLVAKRYTDLEKPGDVYVVSPGAQAYENFARFLPKDEQTASRVATHLIGEFNRMTAPFPRSSVVRIWGHTIQILQTHELMEV